MRDVRSAAATAVLILLVAAGLRLGVAERDHPIQLLGDEYYYLEVSRAIAAGEGHYSARLGAWAAWPPGQSFWLAHFMPDQRLVFEDPRSVPRRALRAQALLGTWLVALIGGLGSLIAGRRVGLVAAALAAILPDLIAFSHYLWATTLFLTLVTSAWCALVWAERNRSRAALVGAGLLFGLASLTRETGLPIALGAAAWWVWRAGRDARPAALRGAALLLLLCGLTILPWTVRNALRTDRFVPIANVGWMALREGNTLDDRDWMQDDGHALAAFRRGHYALPEGERTDRAREETFHLIREAPSGWLGIKFVRNLARLTTPDSILLRKLSMEGYGPLPLGPVRAIATTSVVLNAAILALGVLGLAAARGGLGSLAVTAGLPLLALHVLSVASPRYRMPLVPLFLIGTAGVLCRGREVVAALRRPRILPALAFLLFFLGVSVPDFAPQAARMWSTGSVYGR